MLLGNNVDLSIYYDMLGARCSVARTFPPSPANKNTSSTGVEIEKTIGGLYA